MEETEKCLKIRLRFPGGEEFEAQGNREFIEEQRNYFLSLIGKKGGNSAGGAQGAKMPRPAVSAPRRTTYPLLTPNAAPAPLPELSTRPAAERQAKLGERGMLEQTTGPEMPPSSVLRYWEQILKVDGDLVLLRKKMRLSAAEAASLLIAGAKTLLGKSAYTALDLSRAMRKSGFEEGRLDRLLAPEIRQGHLICQGVKRGRSYQLTNEGFAKAFVLAEKLAGELLI